MTFGVCAYIRLHVLCLYAKRFKSMSFDEEHTWVYDSRHAVNWLPAVGGWVKSWIHWVAVALYSGVRRQLMCTCVLFGVRERNNIRFGKCQLWGVTWN